MAALPAEMCALEKLEVLAIDDNKSLATLLPEIRKLRLACTSAGGDCRWADGSRVPKTIQG